MKGVRAAGLMAFLLTLLVAEASLAQAPVTLEYKFVPGETLAYVLDGSAEATLTFQRDGKQEPPERMTFRGSATSSAEVLRVGPDGTATLRGSLACVKAVAIVNGVEMPAPASLWEFFRATEFRLTKLGVDPGDKESSAMGFVATHVDVGAGNLAINMGLAGKNALALPLADCPVKVGDSWVRQARALLPNNQTVMGTMAFTLLGVEDVGGEQVARIGVKGSAKASNVSLSLTEQGDAPAVQGTPTVDKFTQDMEGTATFSLTKGRLSRVNLATCTHEVISRRTSTGRNSVDISVSAKMSMAPKQ